MKNFRPLILLIITIGVIAVSSPAAECQVNCGKLGFYSIYKASKGA